MRRTDSEDTNKRYFRTQERVFSMNGQWYFTAREGDIGPFRTREATLKEIVRYVRERLDLDRFQRARSSQPNQTGDLALEILPKEDEPDLTLDDLILENQR
jgi:hypothetical protein